MNRNSLTRSRTHLRLTAAFFTVFLLIFCLLPGARTLHRRQKRFILQTPKAGSYSMKKMQTKNAFRHRPPKS